MGLGDWTIDAMFTKKLKGNKGEKVFTTAMRVYVYWEYQYAKIEISYKRLMNKTKKEIENLLVHELTHCLVNEMKEGGIKHEERAVTKLTNAFIWVRNETRREK